MTGKEFKIKRVTFDMTQADIAKELGLNSNTVSRYETGGLPVPKVVELSMEALEKRHIENQKHTTNTQ
jgi:transcriptional regulator with XRE-family HTH domain